MASDVCRSVLDKARQRLVLEGVTITRYRFDRSKYVVATAGNHRYEW